MFECFTVNNLCSSFHFKLTLCKPISGQDNILLFVSNFANDSNALTSIKSNLALIDAWKFLDGSPVIRKTIANLENVNIITTSRTWSSAELVEIQSAITKSTSKEKLITQLKNSVEDINLTNAEIIDLAKSGLNGRAEQAAELAKQGLNFCSAIVDESINVNKLLKQHILSLSKLNDNFVKFDDYILLYQKDKPLYTALQGLSAKLKSGTTIKMSELDIIFAGYEAHHIIPVNRIWNNLKFQEILENSKNTFFNTERNLIFLKNPDIHMGSHSTYDGLINVMLNTKSVSKDINIILTEVDAIKSRMATNLIGTSTKINAYIP